MVTPDTRIHPLPLVFIRARFAHVARTENAMTTIEPAIRSPRKCVEHFVCVGGVIPAIEQNFRITHRFRTIPILDWNKHQVRRRTNPYSAKTDLQSAHEIQIFHEHSPLVGLPIAVRIFKNQDPIRSAENIFQLLRRWLGWITSRDAFQLGRIPAPPRIGHPFCDPNTSTMIQAKGDWLHQIRLGREHVHLESRRQRRFLRGAFRRKSGKRDDISRRRVGGRGQFT